MDIAFDIEALADRYTAVWNEPDPAARRRAVTALWEPDGVETTESARHRGHDAIVARITSAYETLVRADGFRFRRADDVAGHHDTVTFTIHMVPADGGEIAWTGRMVLTLSDKGLIRSDYQFTVATPPEPAIATRAAVTEFLRRLDEGDPDRIAGLFADHVEWLLDWPDRDHPRAPWIRPRRTRADVAEHFREIATFHIPEKSAGLASRVLVDGTEAVVLGEIRQTVRATGLPYTAAFALHLGVENGLITRFGVYEDSLTVAEALDAVAR